MSDLWDMHDKLWNTFNDTYFEYMDRDAEMFVPNEAGEELEITKSVRETVAEIAESSMPKESKDIVRIWMELQYPDPKEFKSGFTESTKTLEWIRMAVREHGEKYLNLLVDLYQENKESRK